MAADAETLTDGGAERLEGEASEARAAKEERRERRRLNKKRKRQLYGECCRTDAMRRGSLLLRLRSPSAWLHAAPLPFVAAMSTHSRASVGCCRPAHSPPSEHCHTRQSRVVHASSASNFSTASGVVRWPAATRAELMRTRLELDRVLWHLLEGSQLCSGEQQLLHGCSERRNGETGRARQRSAGEHGARGGRGVSGASSEDRMSEQRHE